jgi:glycosyltransferase involved in cell wall biosynthesis
VYAPIPGDASIDTGVGWFPLFWADFSKPGLWIICKHPQSLDRFRLDHLGQQVWLQCQDCDYREHLTADRAARCDRIIAMCLTHADHLATYYPFVDRTKLCIIGNGICSDRIKELLPQERDPFRLIWTSCLERNFLDLAAIFTRAREYEPRLNLHVYYAKPDYLSTPDSGIHLHGRVGRPELWRAIQQSNLWVFSTNFHETSCINCMEAQALGAIPICPPLWALHHNVQHGISVRGDVTKSGTRARYVEAILALVSDPELCEKIRGPMQEWALESFNWDRIANQYDAMIREAA